jgi:hypothetical protein
MTSPTRTPTKVPSRRIVQGKVLEVEEPYGRHLRVPPLLLFPLLLAAVVPELLGLVIGALLRTGPPGTARRPVRSLRKGPEFMVTPIHVRDAGGSVVELEVHGYLNATALIRTDRIRTEARRQKGDLPLLAGAIENLTTGRTLRPRRATLWTHFGIPLVLQGLLGVVLLGLSLACLLGAFR